MFLLYCCLCSLLVFVCRSVVFAFVWCGLLSLRLVLLCFGYLCVCNLLRFLIVAYFPVLVMCLLLIEFSLDMLVFAVAGWYYTIVDFGWVSCVYCWLFTCFV